MSDERDKPRLDDSETHRTELHADDRLKLDDHPLKQEGDALADGSGSRQGQSPPSVGRTEST